MSPQNLNIVFSSHLHQLTLALLCVIVHQVKMRTSISKREILSALIERGYTCPNDPFLRETENILFEEFHLDRNKKCDSNFVSEKARNFRLSVKVMWDDYRKLDPILVNNTVRSVIVSTKHTMVSFFQ